MAKAMTAGAYREIEQFEKADLMIKDAYTIVAMAYGEDNVTISFILNSQGMLYKKQGKYERSLESY